MMTNKVVVTLFAGILVVVGWICQRNAAVYDGFEKSSLGGYWETRRFVPGAVEIQSSVVRAGRGAARITLRAGDQIPQERGSELERAELQERWRSWSVEGSAYAYAFSVFLPQGFPIVPTRLVIAQWKQFCPAGECTPDNPVLAIRYEAGELFIAKQVGEKKQILYRTRDVQNRWLDFRFEIRFSRGDRGRIRAWLGDSMIIDHKGASAYPQEGWYSGRGLFYFKVGLYRDRMAEPMTLYVDEYRKEPLPDDRL
jgi:Polysaccharide lyase